MDRVIVLRIEVDDVRSTHSMSTTLSDSHLEAVRTKSNCKHCRGTGLFDVEIYVTNPRFNEDRPVPFVVTTVRCQHTDAFVAEMRATFDQKKGGEGRPYGALLKQMENAGAQFFRDPDGRIPLEYHYDPHPASLR